MGERQAFWRRMAVVFTVCLSLVPAVRVEAISIENLFDSFGNLSTVAGTANVTGGGDNGWQLQMEGALAVNVELSRPHTTMADWAGNLYIADKDAHAIRKVSPDGVLTTIAGTNVGGFDGDGLGVQQQLNFPNGLYTFPNGTTYIYDLGNNMIRRLSVDGELTTVFADPSGLQIGRGLWVSPDESTIYYSSGSEVRRWTESDGVSVVAAGFVALGNLTVDPNDGSLVATDRGGHAVYRILADGSKTRIAGTGGTSGGVSGQPATQVALDEVRGIHFHPEGGYFLATHQGGQVWFVDDSDAIHLVVDGDDERTTHAGDGLPLDSPGRKVSEPRAVTMAPNGDLLITEHDGGYIRVAPAVDPFRMGDLNQDRLLNVRDIDQLSEAVRAANDPQTLDLNFDGHVDNEDRDVWVRQLKETSYGDANLDGLFNSRDLVDVFTAGKYEDDVLLNAGWGDGDWNGDGEFDSRDFVLALQFGGYEQTTQAVSVPEPNEWGIWLLGWLVLLRGRKLAPNVWVRPPQTSAQ